MTFQNTKISFFLIPKYVFLNMTHSNSANMYFQNMTGQRANSSCLIMAQLLQSSNLKFCVNFSYNINLVVYVEINSLNPKSYYQTPILSSIEMVNVSQIHTYGNFKIQLTETLG